MFACFYNAYVWSMLISVILFQNTWLEMRVNIGWIFFGLIIMLFLLQVCTKRLRKIFATLAFSTISLLISSVNIYYILGLERLKIIPASIIREGIMQNRISFETINILLVIITVIGWFLILFLTKNAKKY